VGGHDNGDRYEWGIGTALVISSWAMDAYSFSIENSVASLAIMYYRSNTKV
jgi:hypothetical protein